MRAEHRGAHALKKVQAIMTMERIVVKGARWQEAS